MPRKAIRRAEGSVVPGNSRPHLPKRRASIISDLATGVSHGGFETLAWARQCAREEDLPAWDIFHGNVRVEYHDPR